MADPRTTMTGDVRAAAEAVHRVDCGCDNPDAHTPEVWPHYQEIAEAVLNAPRAQAGARDLRPWRVGGHWGVTIVRQGAGAPDERGRREGDQLIGMALTPELATEVVEVHRRLAELEGAISWGVTCLGCADQLDAQIAAREAGYAEGVRDTRAQIAEEVRALAQKVRVEAWTQSAGIALGAMVEEIADKIAALVPADPTDPKPACPRCDKYGVPARVEHCGPACHEAHTFMPPCERVADQPTEES